MPEIYNDWIPMNPSVPECPLCESTDVSVVADKEKSVEYVCRKCGNKWEEYK